MKIKRTKLFAILLLSTVCLCATVFSGCLGLFVKFLSPSLDQPTYKLSADKTYYILESVDKDATTLHVKATYLGKPVLDISQNAFKDCKKLQTVTFDPDFKIFSIKAYTFKDCTSLTSITLPQSVITLGSLSFYNCTALKSITLPQNLQHISEQTFYNCLNLKTINFSSRLITIAKEAFINCTSLQSLSFPDTLQTIGVRAFYNCTKLTDVTLPTSLSSIEKDAFSLCPDVNFYTKLKKEPATWESSWNGNRPVFWDYCGVSGQTDDGIIWSLKNDQTAYIVGYNGTEANLIIPKTVSGYSVTEISSNAFKNNRTIVSVKIPNTVTTLKEHSFAFCSNLKKVEFESNSAPSLNAQVFKDCEKLEFVYLPSSITSINKNAFYNINNLVASFEGSKMPLSWDIAPSLNFKLVLNGTNTYTKQNDSIYVLTLDGSYTLAHCSAQSALPTISSYIDDKPVTTIGKFSFSKNVYVAKVSIPSQIKTIDSRAFESCHNLSNISFKKQPTVETFKDFAFSDCPSLKEFTIPTSVTTIEACAFNACVNIKTIYIPSTVTTMGVYAFFGCPNVAILCQPSTKPEGWSDQWYVGSKSVIWNADDVIMDEDSSLYVKDATANTMTLVLYNGDNSVVYVPEMVNGCPVTVIGKKAFYDLDFIETLNLSKNITKIEEGAFSDCNNLVSFHFSNPNKVTEIEKEAFAKCSKLRSISIAEGITSIGEKTFAECTNLTDCTMPKTLTSLGANAFYGCSQLAQIEIPANLTTLNNAFSNCSGLVSITFANDGKITEILDKEFYLCINLSSITLPEGIISIGNYAFNGCTALTNVEFPNTVTSIGSQAFYNCLSLTSIVLPNDLTTIKTQTFYGCSKLKNVGLPKNLSCIEDQAFSSCTELSFIDLEECKNLTTLGNSVFNGCSALSFVILPKSITTIGKDVFSSTPKLYTIYCNEGISTTNWNADWNSSNKVVLYGYSSQSLSLNNLTFEENQNGTLSVTGITKHIPKLIIPNIVDGKAVTTIKENAFNDNQSIETVVIPNSVISIGNLAFFGCKQLKTIYFEDNSSLKTIGQQAFSCCIQLTDVTLPESLEVIGIEGFSFCDNLKTVSFKENASLKTISEKAFSSCVKLTTFNFPDSLQTIDKNAFYYCSKLSSIVFGNNSSLEEIGDYAFYACSSVTEITLSPNVSSIGKFAFAHCKKITQIIIPSSLQTLGTSAFAYCDALTNIYCKAEEKPAGWDDTWNSSNATVTWNFKQTQN